MTATEKEQWLQHLHTLENPLSVLGSVPQYRTVSTYHYAAAAKSLQLCPTLYDPIDGSPPGSAVPGIPQAITLEWAAISFSSAWKWKLKLKSLGRVRLFVTPWTTAYQAPLSMGFSRQEYWSGLPLPSPTYHYRLVNIILCAKYIFQANW